MLLQWNICAHTRVRITKLFSYHSSVENNHVQSFPFHHHLGNCWLFSLPVELNLLLLPVTSSHSWLCAFMSNHLCEVVIECKLIMPKTDTSTEGEEWLLWPTLHFSQLHLDWKADPGWLEKQLPSTGEFPVLTHICVTWHSSWHCCILTVGQSDCDKITPKQRVWGVVEPLGQNFGSKNWLGILHELWRFGIMQLIKKQFGMNLHHMWSGAQNLYSAPNQILHRSHTEILSKLTLVSIKYVWCQCICSSFLKHFYYFQYMPFPS